VRVRTPQEAIHTLAKGNLKYLSLVESDDWGEVLLFRRISALSYRWWNERSGVLIKPLEVAVVANPPQGVRKGVAGREARCEDSPPLGRKAGKCSVA